MTPLYLCLFDISVCIETNDADLHHFVSVVYRRLLTTEPDGRCLTYAVIQAAGQAILTTPTATFTLEQWPTNRDDVLDLILFEAFSKVQSHMMFHGAALAVDGKGVAIVADSMQGKTTLALGLLQAGAQFMSDESVAIDLETSELSGMPRALSIRPKTHQLLNLTITPDLQLHDHTFYDVESLFSGAHTQGASLRKVLVLSNELQKQPANQLHLRLHNISAEWRSAVTALPAVQTMKLRSQAGSVDVKLQVSERHQTFAQIQALAEIHNILILNAHTHVDASPDFARTPAAERLGKAEAAIDMLSHLQGGHQSDLITKRFAGDEGRLFQALIHGLSQADCYRLQVGYLPATLELVQELIHT